MDQKFPFTPLGCQALQAKLYTLPQAELDAEADVLQLNFKDWMISHFLLSQDQIDYLGKLSQQATAFTAEATSTAVRNRLPVILIKSHDKPEEEEEEKPKGEIFKILDAKNELTVTEGQGLTAFSGQVTISLEYLTPSGRH